MNAVINVITDKISKLFLGRPAVKVGDVTVWGDFTNAEKEHLCLVLVGNQKIRELEEKDKRITALENKLAVPVKLPRRSKLGSTEDWYQGFAAAEEGTINDCATAIRDAGFNVEVDGSAEQ
ncbi:hypothetical protein [Serratia liquefaciens]|uniref:hypothetical protein n=1 Tax=Serratia liquefaciens TaxID=614 RepID=UPI0021C983A9|nr:hypothetical protein [Serratia liquefaciens]